MKKRIDLTRFKKSITHHFLLRTLHLLGASSVYFLSACILTLIVYVLGNFQGFLADTQLSVLYMVQVLGIIGFVVSLYYVILLITWGIRRKKLPAARLIAALLAIILDLGLAIGSLLIQDLSRGIG